MGKSESALMKLFSKKPTTHSNFLFSQHVWRAAAMSLFINILGKFVPCLVTSDLRHHEHEICPTVSFSFQRSADFHFEMWREGWIGLGQQVHGSCSCPHSSVFLQFSQATRDVWRINLMWLRKRRFSWLLCDDLCIPLRSAHVLNYGFMKVLWLQGE